MKNARKVLAISLMLGTLLTQGVFFGKFSEAKQIGSGVPTASATSSPAGMRVSAASFAPRAESSRTPEVTHTARITQTSSTQAPSTNATNGTASLLVGDFSAAQSQALTQQSAVAPANLIPNPSLESTNSAGLPTGWYRGGYGTNARTYLYPVSGSDGAKAAQVSLSNYVSGDGKWYFDDISVIPGHAYQFSDFYISNVLSVVVVRYKMSSGAYTYQDVASLPASAAYQSVRAQFIAPPNAASLTIFHLINRNGSLTTDAYSLTDTTPSPVPSPTPPPNPNLIQNPGFEQSASNGLPVNWLKGGWGTNTRQFFYPTTGPDGSKAAQVAITSYSSGDAKWHFSPIPTPPAGIYTYADQYLADAYSFLTVQYHATDGSYAYKNIASLSPARSWVSVSVDLAIPANTQDITIFHLIKDVGSLTLDNASLKLKSVPQGIFTTGAVSLRFDDGWLSQYQNALPKLQSAGLKGTFYIVSKQMADNGFPDFMSAAQVKDMSGRGHEIGAHTRTHPYLSQLGAQEQQNEIAGSRQDLLQLNVGPVNAFAYPFGDYTSTTVQIVKDAGFSSAASTLDGFATPSSDPYQLERFSVEANVATAQVTAQIDQAVAKKQWLILAFHQITTTGEQYSTTPQAFNEIIDYLVQKNVPVITVSQGMQSLKP